MSERGQYILDALHRAAERYERCTLMCRVTLDQYHDLLGIGAISDLHSDIIGPNGTVIEILLDRSDDEPIEGIELEPSISWAERAERTKAKVIAERKARTRARLSCVARKSE